MTHFVKSGYGFNQSGYCDYPLTGFYQHGRVSPVCEPGKGEENRESPAFSFQAASLPEDCDFPSPSPAFARGLGIVDSCRESVGRETGFPTINDSDSGSHPSGSIKNGEILVASRGKAHPHAFGTGPHLQVAGVHGNRPGGSGRPGSRVAEIIVDQEIAGRRGVLPSGNPDRIAVMRGPAEVGAVVVHRNPGACIGRLGIIDYD